MDDNSSNHPLGHNVPPIMIHAGTPCPPTPSDCNMNMNNSSQLASRQHSALNGRQEDPHTLPQLSMHRSVLSGGQSPYRTASSQWNSAQTHTSSPFKHPSDIFANLKQELDVSCSHSMRRDVPNNLQLQKSRILNRLSPNQSNANTHHLQLPSCSFSNTQVHSPTFSDVSSIRLTPQSQGRQNARLQKMHLPPVSGYSHTDLEDSVSPVIPPLTSLSPYLGSGISEVPSFPSILSPQGSSHHLSRKRALSTSPFSDMLDLSGIRSSPNSLYAAMFGSQPMTPNGPGVNGEPTTGSVGHLVGQSNPVVPPLQYRVQKRKTSIEHNQNVDGTTDTTITNQITYTEQRHQQHLAKYNALGSQPQSNLAVHQVALQSMDHDHLSSRGSMASQTNSSLSNQPKEEIESYLCQWEGCSRTFDEQEDLVQHIESKHIEKGKMDDFTCLWRSCIRNRKPFNARYKLIIHMRIHSGEKPNKCTVSCSLLSSSLSMNY